MDKPETKDKSKDYNYEWQPLPWKAWGSWFSWGSPIGLGLGWTLFILPLGLFLWILHSIGLWH